MPLIVQADSASEDVYWRKVRKWNSITGYRAYLKTFPDGLFAEDVREKIAKLEREEGERARQAAKPSDAAAAPNKPIPGSFLVSPKVIQFIESHPAFADAPPVFIRRLEYSKVFPNNPLRTISVKINYTWLRQGLVQTRLYEREPDSDGGVHIFDLDEISYLNGRFQVAHTANSQSKNRGSLSRSKTIGIKDIRGKLFPLKEGNEVTFTAIDKSYDSDNSESVSHFKRDFRVGKRISASELVSRLTGYAWEFDYTFSFLYSDGEDVTKVKIHFVEALGTFCSLEYFGGDNPDNHYVEKIDNFTLR